MQLTKRADITDGVESDEDYREGLGEGDFNATENQEKEAMVSGTMSNVSNSAHVPAARRMCSPSSRPLVRKRLGNTLGKSGGEDFILEIMKMSMLQEQKRREAEHRRYLDEKDAERLRRDEERSYRTQRIEEERLRREEEHERRKEDGKGLEEDIGSSNQMMHMMLMALLGHKKGVQSK
ncbi:hypothetical protein BWQ96_07181 [Gracilariopsis chorda]|uniref:Uncharacterized protein n=1 Tax=Gracilariopsis chorda TaxID=448386 RepID=A0A2V3ILY1_9FLOR|nr:hypothetical protein BWQ96_07181 [Gracilariopsis chorda]|eukprot:PXF43095.1 hypothetical protein BWQ96_07181 [Gracilariopsis chorda]